ncbi:MAG: translocation/assembly module TamB [Flavobacteriales bacterium]|nr:translocation/assembly module TamB [Flavobacteriales bacterium]
MSNSANQGATETTALPAWLDQQDGFRFWTRGLDIGVRELALTHGDFQMHRHGIHDPAELLDPDHLVFSAIDLHARNAEVHDDLLAVRLEALSAAGAHGTELRASVAMNATPAMARLEEGMVAVDGTEVRFSATAAQGDLSSSYRNPKQVPLQGSISSNVDLAKLPRLLAQLGVALPKPLDAHEIWNTQVAFSGTAERIDTVRVDILGDRGTVVHLLGDAQDPAALPNTVFHADLREITLGEGLRGFVAPYMPADVPLPTRLSGRVRMSGSGDGLEADIALRSDLGDIEGQAGVSGFRGQLPDALSAELEIRNVDLGRFTADTAIGIVSAHLHADGQALNSVQRSGRVEVTTSRLWYHGQDLSGTRLLARVDGDSLHAQVTATATAAAVTLNAHARWPVGGDTISGALDLRVDRLGLKEMGWYAHPLNVQGQWSGTGMFSTDGFAAFAINGDSVVLFNSERSFRFEEFVAKGRLASDSALFQLDTDALDVTYSTNVPMDSLLPRAKEKLLSYFRTDSSFTPAPGTRMDLQVALPRTEWLTGIVLPELEAIELKDFTGHYDGDTDALLLNIDLPILRYKEFTVAGVRVAVDAQGNALNGTLRMDSARYQTYHIHKLAITANSGPGILRTALRIRDGEKSASYVVPMDFQRLDEGIAMHIADGLVLDTLAWQVDRQNALRFTDTGPVAEHFNLNSGAQRMELITSGGSTVVHLEMFNMGNVLNIVSVDDSVAFVGGAISGDVTLPLNENTHMRADLRVDDLAVIGHPLGDMVVQAQGAGEKRYEGTLRLENGPNVLDASARFDGGKEQPSIEAHADIGLADMSFLHPFVSGVLYDINGGLRGAVDLKTSNGRNSVQGDLTFTDAALGVVRTGARYTLRNERVLADATGFYFHDFTVLDSLGNAFILDGQVHTEDLSSMRFDLALHTDSFQLVSSAPSRDALFYGDLLASADVRITGTDRAPVVKGDLGILAGTDLSVVLPGSEVKLVQSDGIVEFTTDLSGTDTTHTASNEERMRDSLRAQLPRVDLDLRMRIDPRAAFAVVLDPTTGDQATFKGDGDLRFRYTPDGDMFLNGPFTVSEGGYTLEFYGLVKKRFDLVPGSQVVWDGDPIGARMDIHARYVSESAAYPLVANASGALSEAERNRLATRMPFEVIINIDGAVKKPDITFGIDLPRDYRNSYPKVNDELDRLSEKSREEERNRQVFGLLVLNSFIQDEAAGGAPTSGLVTNAARNSVNGILTDQLNKVTGRLVKGVDIQLGVNTAEQVEGSGTYQRTSVDYKVSKSFLNERLSFEVGGSVGVDERNVNASNVSSTRAAQYAILYDLTRDGRFRLRGFYENAFDLYDGEITDSGVALMYTREFEENEIAREAQREAIRQRQKEELQRQRNGREKRGDTAPTGPAKP